MLFSSELVGSVTQPPQFCVVEEPAGLAELYVESYWRGENSASAVSQHVPVALEKLLGVVAALEMVSVPAFVVKLPLTAVIVVFAGMPLPTMTLPTVGVVVKETLETVVLPAAVVAPRLVKVKTSPVAAPVALAESVSVFADVLTEVT